MQIDHLEQQLDNARNQYQQLRQKFQNQRTDRDLLTAEALNALQRVLEELQVAVEEQQQQHETLLHLNQEQERQLYQNLFELAPDAALVTDDRGVILAANVATADLFQIREPGLLGKPLIVLVDQPDHGLVYRCIASIRQGHRTSDSARDSVVERDRAIRLRSSQGEQIPATLSLTTARTPRGHHRLYWFFRDQRKRPQQESDRLPPEPYIKQELQRIAEENRQFRETLTAQEATYRHLFDCNPQPMWVYDLETLQFLAVNDAAIAKYGYSRAEFLAMTIADIRPPEDVPRLRENIAAVDAGLDMAGPWQHCLRNGQIIQVNIVSYALEFEGRQAELVMVQDDTDRIQTQQALQQSEERYRHLVELSPQLIWNADDNGHNTYVSPQMCEYIGLPALQLLNLDWQTVIHPADLEEVRRRWMASVRSGNPYHAEYRLRRADGVYRWHLVQAVRVEHGQASQWFGMSTDIDDRKRAELALQELNHALEQTVAERTAEVRKNRAELQAILNNSPAKIFVEDLEGRYIFVNQAFLSIFNCQLEDVLGKTTHEFLPPDIADAVRANDPLPLEQGGVRQFEEVVRVNGEERVFLSQKFLLRDDQDQVYAICGMSTDITDRKAIEADLQASRDRLQAMLAALPDHVFRVNRAGHYLDFYPSNYAPEITGLDTLVGHTMTEILPPEVAQAHLQRIEQALSTQAVQVSEQEVQINGERLVREVRVAPCSPDEVLFVIRDITDRKHTEVQLKRQLAAIEAAVDGIAILQKGHFLYLNQAHLEIFGYTNPEELIGQPWTVLYSPEEQARLAGAVFPTLEQDGVWVGEVIATRKDGTPFDQGVSLTGTEDGLVICVCEDISDRKAAERALQASQSFLQTVLETAPIAIFWKDLQGIYQGANTKTAEVFGLSSTANLLGHTDAQLAWSPEVVENIQAEDRQIITTQKPYLNIVQHLITTTGVEVWLEINKVPLYDEEGNLFAILGTAQNVTERKWAELALQASQQFLKIVLDTTPVGIFWKNHDGVYQGINIAATAILDLPEASAIIGCTDADLPWHPNAVAEIQAEDQQIMATDQPRLNILQRFALEDDSQIWLETNKVPLKDAAGNVIGVLGTAQDVTQRKRAELERQDLTDRLTLALQAGGCGTWTWDLSDTITWDQQMYAIFGVEDPDYAPSPQDWWSFVVAEDRPWIEAQLSKVLAGEQNLYAEFRIRRPDGEQRWIQLYGQVQWDDQGHPTTLVGINRDITHRKLAERSLEASETRFRRVFDSDIVGMMFTDFSGQVFKANDRFLNMLGYTRADLDAQIINWTALTPPEHQAKDLEAMETLHHQGSIDPWEKEYFRKDGSRVAVLVGVALFNEADTQCVCVVIDISDRKKTELALQRTNEELARATRLKDEFLANMSHELRTPLNAILGMTEGLQEEVFGPITERQQRSLSTIERSGNHLLSLINDILDLSKIEAGQLELNFAPVSVIALCDSSLTFVKQQAYKKHLQIETQIPAHLPDLYGDDRRLRQVLINLLTNAVKFTPEGGRITLSAIYTPLSPEAIANHRDWVHPQAKPAATVGILALAVSDTGIGISPENTQKLFQPFMQVDTALNRQYEGTGLGLALVKRITELHGGQVELTSEVGNGSCFTVRLPVLAIPGNHPPAADPAAPLEATPPVDRGTTPLILLAEDNDANINTTTAYLTAKGFYLVVAKNGLEAVNLAQTTNPDLILMDIQMPELDGLEAIHQIRQIPALVNVPIIALTALAMEGDRDRCLAAGADDYLSKPVKLKVLTTRIQQLLSVTDI